MPCYNADNLGSTMGDMDELLTYREKALLIGILLVSALISASMVGFIVGFALGKLAA